MPIPIVGGAAAVGVLQAGFALAIAAGILRVITLIGIGIVTYEGVNVLVDRVTDMASFSSSGGTGAFQLVGPLLTLLKFPEAVAVITGAIGTKLLTKLSFAITRPFTP